MFVTVKFLDRNRLRGTSGWEDRAIRKGKAMAATAPMPSDMYGTGPFQFTCWPTMAPKLRPPTARKTTAAPTQSNCPVASSSRLSATCRRVAYRPRSTSGTLMKNTARHEMASTSSPPTLLTLEGRRDDGQRPGHQQRPGGALEHPEHDEQDDVRGHAAQQGGCPEPHQADGEHLSPPEEVVQGPGQDQQRRQRQ